MIKYASIYVKIRFLDLLSYCWKRQYIPESCKKAHIIPIFEKGDRSKCENYRGICLLNEGYKIYAKIITPGLQKNIEAIILEERSGFSQGRSCAANIFILKQLIGKHREFNHELHLLFVDYVKAFDRADREKFWNILYKRCISHQLIAVISNMYKGTKISLITNSVKMLCAEINLGVRQGWSISQILFNNWSRVSSGSIVSDYGLDDRGSIPGRGRGFFL
jgi:hypothetical protein